MSRLLSFQPVDQILFVPTGNTARAELRISNVSNDSYVIFKIKTNAAERYVVKPHIGVLRPGERDRLVTFSVQVPHLSSFLSDMESQRRSSRKHTAFLVLGYAVNQESGEQVLAQPPAQVTPIVQQMWKEQEARDKANGTTSFEQQKFPAAYYDGSEQADTTGAAAAPAKSDSGDRSSSAAPAPSGEPAATPAAGGAGSEFLPGMSYQEAVRLRASVNDLAGKILSLTAERDGLERRCHNRERELEEARRRLTELEVQVDQVQQQAGMAAAGAKGLRQRKGAAAEGGADAQAEDDDLSTSQPVGFALWHLIVVAVVAFLLGRLVTALL